QRSVNRLQVLRPQGCSIYTRDFWRHERYWKIPSHTWVQAFNGTPFKPMIWRALGVRIGRRVFDDGLTMPEKCLVTIGDDCTFNTGSTVQCHSQEDGAFKSDRTTIGNGVTLGVGAFIHYGVTIGDNAVLAADSFVMKGEDVPARTRWIGNPAAPGRAPLSSDRPTQPDRSTRSDRVKRYAAVLIGAAALTLAPTASWVRYPTPQATSGPAVVCASGSPTCEVGPEPSVPAPVDAVEAAGHRAALPPVHLVPSQRRAAGRPLGHGSRPGPPPVERVSKVGG
ncbi:MAG TPA: DapH/DapD/GlmU-related protein, partial [Pseudonocardia sp.]|nr:DapH/DapD/GlmU-related protein [Pseudonocardia sp.]